MSPITLLKNGTPVQVEYDKTLVFIGANGTGKSRLGAWIEQNNPAKTHRISAQRNLSFKNDSIPRSLSQSIKFLYFGDEHAHSQNYTDTHPLQAKSSARWHSGKYTTALLDDYNHLLSLLFAEQNTRNEKLAKKVTDNVGQNIDENFKESSNIEKLITVWDTLLPHRKLEFTDQKIIVKKDTNDYFGTELSDGERVIIYLMGQVLSVESGFILIIDEPEIHIHKSILNPLWDELEKLRDDISIFYITHDLEFAKERYGSKKIWLKGFDGSTNWEWEEISFDDGAQFNQLHYEILGSRKPVLFTEGEKGSLDYKIYTKLFPEFTIIPVQSCTNVINMVSSYKKEWTLHNIQPIGIIDRDFREETDIHNLETMGIKTLDVLEIENLFALPKVVEYMYDVLSATFAFEKSKEEILNALAIEINTKFSTHFEKIIHNMLHKVISDKLAKFARPSLGDGMKIKYDEYLSSINVDGIENKIRTDLSAITDIDKKLLYLDDKGFIASVSKLLSMEKNRYIQTVLKHIEKNKLQEILFSIVPRLDTNNAVA